MIKISDVEIKEKWRNYWKKVSKLNTNPATAWLKNCPEPVGESAFPYAPQKGMTLGNATEIPTGLSGKYVYRCCNCGETHK